MLDPYVSAEDLGGGYAWETLGVYSYPSSSAPLVQYNWWSMLLVLVEVAAAKLAWTQASAVASLAKIPVWQALIQSSAVALSAYPALVPQVLLPQKSRLT